MLAYFPVWRRNYLCNIKKEVFPLKHRICSLRATLAAALVLVILFVPALAAEITVDYTSEYRFSAADFSSSAALFPILFFDHLLFSLSPLTFNS